MGSDHLPHSSHPPLKFNENMCLGVSVCTCVYNEKLRDDRYGRVTTARRCRATDDGGAGDDDDGVRTDGSSPSPFPWA